MPNIRRVRTVWTGVAGTPYYSNFYFKDPGATATQITNAVNAFWTATRAIFVTAATATTETFIAVIDDATGELVGSETGPGGTVTGSATGSMLSPATQVLVRNKTGLYQGGRQVQGHFNIPAIGANQLITTGNFAAASQTIVNNAASNLIAAPGVWSVYAKTRGISVPINSATAWEKFSVLRSRRD